MECSNNVRCFFPPLPFIVLVPLHHPPISGNSTRRLCSLYLLNSILIETNPCLWNSLTGLLSFMLSDEMTTGSITSCDSHKRTFAARSHSWNVAQPRFKEAFPEVSEPIKYLILLYSWICSYLRSCWIKIVDTIHHFLY